MQEKQFKAGKGPSQNCTKMFHYISYVYLYRVVLPISSSAFNSTNPDNYQMKAVRTGRIIDITGILSDAICKSATPIEMNYEIQPGENTPPLRRHLFMFFTTLITHTSGLTASTHQLILSGRT
ncbi:MAG: hypothetical protein ACLP05_07250 [Candidatus Kryptoniota bacterium]